MSGEYFIISHQHNGMLLRQTEPGRALAWTRRLDRALLFTTYEQAVSFHREHHSAWPGVVERLDTL